MTSRRHLVVYNPTAAQGKAAERIPETEALLSEKGIDYELRVTQRVWHGAELARDAGNEGYSVVVAAGGDGTVNEVVNGLMLARDHGEEIPAMGVLSIGRGNDFSYGADVPGSLADCVEVLAAGCDRPIDIRQGVRRRLSPRPVLRQRHRHRLRYDRGPRGRQAQVRARFHGLCYRGHQDLRDLSRRARAAHPARPRHHREGEPPDVDHERQADGRHLLHGAQVGQRRRRLRLLHGESPHATRHGRPHRPLHQGDAGGAPQDRDRPFNRASRSPR